MGHFCNLCSPCLPHRSHFCTLAFLELLCFLASSGRGGGGGIYNHKNPLPEGAAGKGTVKVALRHLLISSHFQKHLTQPPGVRNELLPISEHLSVAEPASSQTRPPATWPRPLPAPTGHSSSQSLCICSCLPAPLLTFLIL